MSKLRILIADDEPLARERLRALLAPARPDAEIVAETATGPDTIASVKTLQPDVVLLDVGLPGCDGLSVASQLPTHRPPLVIFVTAHAHHAVEAFRAGAVDYLLKPFSRERFEAALTRAANRLVVRRSADVGQRLTDRLNARRDLASVERFALPCDGRVVLVRSDEIAWVEAASNYSTLHLLDRRRVMIRGSLSSLELRLGSRAFARVSRSALARIDQVRELRAVGYGDYAVVLRSGVSLSLSRHLRGQIERFLT